jgi:hypothetical protein
MKIQSHALLIAVASVLGTAAHAQSNGAGNTSLNAIRSIVNPSVVVEDSFNRTTDIDTRVSTDNSRSAVGSFNQDNDTTVDASRRTVTSVDASRRTWLDVQTVTPTVNSRKDISTLDTQTASNVARMSGPTQVGTQGDFNVNLSGGGQPAYAHGGFYRSPAETNQSYDLAQANSVRLGGDNNGLIRNQNNMNLGGAQISDSDLGNKMVFSAGSQALGQGVDQNKESATQTHASDSVSTTVSK